MGWKLRMRILLGLLFATGYSPSSIADPFALKAAGILMGGQFLFNLCTGPPIALTPTP